MKNKFLKIASLLVMLCLISACAIGTTFAKYTTGDTAGDSARVAKWGVRVTMVGDDLFNNEYATDDTTHAGTLSVKSVSGDDVVAPGTSGKTTFSITGSPEVAVRIVIDFNAVSDIVLPAGSVTGQTADYHPIVFTLTQTHDYNGEIKDEHGNAAPVELKKGTLAEIQSFLDAYSGANGHDFKLPETDGNKLVLDSTYELSWAWAYESGNDAADTLLGDIIAGEATVAGAVTEIKYDLSITVTQID